MINESQIVNKCSKFATFPNHNTINALLNFITTKRVLILFLVFISINVRAQENNRETSFKNLDAIYGIDDFLNNGRMYFPEWDIKSGSSYLNGISDENSSVVLEGKKYVNQKIKFNLFKEQFVLSYVDGNKGKKQIIINPESIDTVYMHHGVFVPSKYDELPSNFVQVIFDDEIKCIYSWKISKTFKVSGDNAGYHYSKPQAIKYLVYNDDLIEFKSKRQFLKIFPEDLQAEINAMIKKNSIRFRKITPLEMGNLVNFCQSKIEE